MRPHNNKIILSVIGLIFLALIILVVWKFPYFSWHLYIKHKIPALKNLNKEKPIKNISSINKTNKNWEEVDFLEFTILIPNNPKKVIALKKAQACVFLYEDLKITVWHISSFRKQVKFPFITENGKIKKMFPFQHAKVLNKFTENDIKFSNDSQTNARIIQLLSIKAVTNLGYKKIFLFENESAKGIGFKITKDTKNQKIRYFQVFSPNDKQGFNCTILNKNQNKIDDQQFNKIIYTILGSIKFSENFPSEEEITDKIKTFAVDFQQ